MVEIVEIVESMEIRAPAERVFQALTTPSELLSWWGDPAVCTSTHWELDQRVGGKWRSRWRWADSGEEFDIWGEVLEIDPPRLLVYSWRDQRYPDVATTTVRYDVVPTDLGCRVTVTHSGFVGETPDYNDYRGGWSIVLGGLRAATEVAPASA
jgi:uncharacterized protein YndB with AHSA1/START domain